MINKIKNREGGFLKLIIIVIIVFLLMRYFGITFTGILEYFNLTWEEVIRWFQKALEWFKNLFESVK